MTATLTDAEISAICAPLTLAHDVPWGADPTAATRRAIVLVAADMAN